MTEISHNLTKQQIVSILRAESTLFDVNNLAKINYLEVAEPDGLPIPTPPTYPALWVTNSRTLETIIRKGINDSNKHTYLTHDVNYLLKIMVNEQDSIVAEKTLDDFQKLVMETLEADVNLVGTAWASGVNYLINDIRNEGTMKFIAIQDHLSVDPTNKPPNVAFWTEIENIQPDDSWPERVETFRVELDGGPVRGKTITWHYKFTSN